MKSDRSWLDDLAIASPCTADWNRMRGDDRCRFCSQCNLHVFDLSAMTRPEAERLVRERTAAATGTRLCVRFTRRADGTVLTRDCPVGLRRHLRRAGARVIAACSALLAIAGCRRPPTPPEPAPEPTPTTTEAPQVLQGDVAEAAVLMGAMPAPTPTEQPPK